MGVGIGGDYPLSAVISSEFASTKIRGRMMAAVFANQGWGNFGQSAYRIPLHFFLFLNCLFIAAALVAFIITAGYKKAILAETDITKLSSVDHMWRLLIGLGCVPGCVALYFRLTIPETPRFTMDIERNIDRAQADIAEVIEHRKTHIDEDQPIHRIDAPRASFSDFRNYFGQWKNFKVLFGCAYSWFALDVRPFHLFLILKNNRPQFRLHTTVLVSTLPSSLQPSVSETQAPKVSEPFMTTWLISASVTSSCPLLV